jgi:hypothetical protein
MGRKHNNNILGDFRMHLFYIYDIIIFVLILLPFNLHAQTTFTSCIEDVARQTARSQELQKIVAADQTDRDAGPNIPQDQWPAIQTRDEQRRSRVGAIFGEGCFKTPKDFAAAALVFQHGNVPDHFFQTYIWSKRGVELGDDSQKRMMTLAIDRYLVNTGHKQLFASQARKPDSPNLNCWCLEPVEESFPDALRPSYNARTIKDALHWIDELNANTTCPAASQCLHRTLKPSPAGTVPGLW